MFTNLFIKNGPILHIVINEECWTQYLGLDADPVQWKHERVELLTRRTNHFSFIQSTFIYTEWESEWFTVFYQSETMCTKVKGETNRRCKQIWSVISLIQWHLRSFKQTSSEVLKACDHTELIRKRDGSPKLKIRVVLPTYGRGVRMVPFVYERQEFLC